MIQNPLDGDLFAKWSDLRGLDILCLGMSESQMDTFLAPSAPNSVHSLTLWSDHVDAKGQKYPIVIGDVTQRTDFPDRQFDAVITMSVLEHVSDVGAALAEMARITKSGGQLLHIFGPAWSCAYGHHLCTASDNPQMNFYTWQMPAHMHLLCTEKEVMDYYEEIGLGREMGQVAHSEFHVNDHINRMYYDEYAALFATYQVIRSELMYNPLPEEHLRRLRWAAPGRNDFSTYGGAYKMLV